MVSGGILASTLCVGRSCYLCFVSMEPLSDAEIVGVDILQCPVEVGDVTAPSPSAIPLPSFGCQGIGISTFLQDFAQGSS